MTGKLKGMAVALLVAGSAAQAEENCTQTVVFNHQDRTIKRAGSAEKLEGDPAVLRTSSMVCLKVEGTSTGAFDVHFDTAAKEDLGNVAALKTFFGDFKPLQLDLIRGTLSPAEGRSLPALAKNLTSEQQDLKGAVNAIDKIIDHARDLEFRVVEAISQMARDPAKTSGIVNGFADCGNPGSPSGLSHLRGCKDTLDELEELPGKLNALADALKKVEDNLDPNTIDDSAVELVKAAREQRRGFPKLVGSAQQLSQWVQRVRDAKTSADGPAKIRPKWDEGVLVVVTITPAAVGELGSMGRGATFKLKLLPLAGPRLSVGASLVYAPNAIYPSYAEVAQEDGSRVIAEGKILDRRLLWGVTLSATWSRFDDRDDSGLALFLPELLISPDEDGLAVGLGTAASWKAARVSTGLLWAKRPILEGQTVGMVLGEGQALKVREGYSFGAPTWYLGFGLAL